MQNPGYVCTLGGHAAHWMPGSPVSGISTLTGAPRAAQEARLDNDSLRPQGVWYALRRRHQQRRGAFPCTLVVGRHVTERLQIAFAERYARRRRMPPTARSQDCMEMTIWRSALIPAQNQGIV